MKSEYRNEGMDFKKLALYFRKRIWIVVLMIVLGAAIGALGYQVARSVRMPIEYESVSKLYIKFNVDESGEVYQYYNGYTWNELLDSDPIMECIMAYLPSYSAQEVREATNAEIISDIRLLTITVKADNEKKTREIQNAVEKGLTTYAINSDELASITTVRSIQPERIYWKDRTTATAVWSGLALGIVTFFIFFFGFLMNDAIYVQSDLVKRYSYKALGIMPRSQKGLQPYLQELKANILYTLKDSKNLVFIDVDDHSDLRAQDFDRILNYMEGGSLKDMVWHVNDEEDDLFAEEAKKEWTIYPINGESVDTKECEYIKNHEGVIILVPFGSTSAPKKLERILTLLNNQDINILGMIIDDADEDYLMRYYS